MTTPVACSGVRERAPELALGVLVGAERAAVLDHLERCTECRHEVQRFAAAADAVLQLAPVAEPPAGFEVRLLERRAGGREPGHVPALRRRARAAVAAAAAVVIAAGIGVSLGTSSGGPAAPKDVRTAQLSYDGSDRGSLVVAEGHPAMLVMTVDVPHWSGWVRCVVRESGGDEVTVGRFWLANGHGSWSVRLHMPAMTVRGAAIVEMGGATMASGTLPA